jgi:serine protease Do
MIGETVIAVGNPFGYQHTVTTGVVSALDRTIEPAPGTKYEGLLQTDAAINPGNSGGPLLNIRGELIGINTAIRAGAQNMGFAIPVDRVREIMGDLLRMRRVGGAWLGLRFRTDRASEVVVASVEKGSPADAKGIQEGDRIERLDGAPAGDLIDFETRLLDHTAGDTVRLGVRRDGEVRDVEIALAEPPEPNGRELALAKFGLHLQTLTPDLSETMRLLTSHGLLVAGVDEGSPADDAGFRLGDIIVQVGRYRVEDLDTLGRLLATVEAGDRVLMYVVRGRSVMRAVLTARAGEGNGAI